MHNLLIVEDDPVIQRGLSRILSQENYEVTAVANGSEALSHCMDNYNLIILDINLPDISGFELCKEIRNRTKCPIFFLTARDSEMDQLKGYKLGADDYISKPFSTEILIYKIKAFLRQSKVKAEFKTRNITYSGGILYKDNILVKLTPLENRLLNLFIRSDGSVLTKEYLIDNLWTDQNNFIEANTLSVTINRLRKKIENDYKKPEIIKTLFGIGFYIDI